MATIRRFEDIEAWQKARELTRAVYKISASQKFARDYALKDQLRRAAVSVMSNIAEGFERGGAPEFRRFLTIAKGSAGELEAQLYIALDQQYITGTEFHEVSEMAGCTKRLIAGFIVYLANTLSQRTKSVRQPATSNP